VVTGFFVVSEGLAAVLSAGLAVLLWAGFEEAASGGLDVGRAGPVCVCAVVCPVVGAAVVPCVLELGAAVSEEACVVVGAVRVRDSPGFSPSMAAASLAGRTA